MKSSLKNYRQSPRKVRLVADAIRGKKVADAHVELKFMPKRASDVIRKLIDSAAANAVTNQGQNIADLVVKNVEVNQGVTLKRHRARARGSAFKINKRTSNINITLENKNSKVEAPVKEDKKVAKKVVKKAAVKKTELKKAPAKAVTKKVVKKSVKKVAK